MNIYRLPVFTDETLSRIAWGMENQEDVYLLDRRDGSIHKSGEDALSVPKEFLLELPPWGSSDGYQMMISFVNACSDSN